MKCLKESIILAFNQKQWGNQRKRGARKVGIEQAKVLFGSALQSDLQWWSMCGQCADATGDIRGSEPHQLVQDGFITSKQFWGVELNRKIMLHNKASAPQFNWRSGDFLNVMGNASARGVFNPGVVNMDTTWFPTAAAEYLGKLMVRLNSSVQHEVLVMVNVVFRHLHHKADAEDMQFATTTNPYVVQAIQAAEWSVDWSSYFEYQSLSSDGRSHTDMGTFFFVKEAM